MKAYFRLPVAPISVNSTYYANKRHGMRPEAKEFQENCFYAMSSQENKTKFEALRSAFDATKHGYSVTLVTDIPKHHFYTKAGLISNKTCDLSNVEKLTIDTLFLPKHFGTNVPKQAENLNIDDKFLISLVSKKRPIDGLNYCIHVEIEIVELSSLG